MKKLFPVILPLLLGCLPLSAQPRVDTLSVQVRFRRDYSTLDAAFCDNGAHLDAFAARLRRLLEQDSVHLRGVVIVAGASPEGSDAANRRLSEKRAERIRTAVRERIALDEALFRVVPQGVDWEGLTRLVAASQMPYRDETLDILRNTPVWVIRHSTVVDSRHRRLEMLRGGRAWQYMYERFFPALRSAAFRVVCEVERTTVPQPVPMPDTVSAPDTLPAGITPPTPDSTATTPAADLSSAGEPTSDPTTATQAPEPQPTPQTAPVADKACKPFYMALKTNLLYDAALVPNLGAEFYAGRGWSVGGSWMYAWWNSDRRHRYWRAYGGEVDLRKYFGRRAEAKPLTGHHLGLYAQALTYDVETGGRGYMGGVPGGTLFDRAHWGVGVEYGYSLPIGRRLNLDFGIGVGYLGGEYREYIPLDTHYVWQSTRQRHWFGPTKAEVSLVWLLGCGNVNAGKGDRR